MLARQADRAAAPVQNRTQTQQAQLTRVTKAENHQARQAVVAAAEPEPLVKTKFHRLVPSRKVEQEEPAYLRQSQVRPSLELAAAEAVDEAPQAEQLELAVVALEATRQSATATAKLAQPTQVAEEAAEMLQAQEPAEQVEVASSSFATPIQPPSRSVQVSPAQNQPHQAASNEPRSPLEQET